MKEDTVMKKQYVKPEMICIPLMAPTLLAGSPDGTHDEVSNSSALSRGFDWDDEN